MIQTLRKSPVLTDSVGSIMCPTCNNRVPMTTKFNTAQVTIKIKCKKCNRKIVKTTDRDKHEELKKLILSTWNSSLTPTMDDDL